MNSSTKIVRSVRAKVNNLNSKSSGDKIFDIVNYSVLAVLFIIWVYPLYFVAIASISDPYAVYRGEIIFYPKSIDLSGYYEIINMGTLWSGYLNSIVYTSVGVLINMILTTLGAYSMSRPELMIRNAIMKMFLFTMFFSGGLIPTFILIKQLGIYNTMWALILPVAVSTYNLIIMRTFFSNSLPGELRDAAFLDGCGDFQYLVRIALPLSKSVLAVIALYYAIGHWNSYFSAMIYLDDQSKYTLQLVLRNILLYASSMMGGTAGDPELATYYARLAESIKYSAIIIASLPPLLVYPFVQKSFVKGVLIGAVKG